MIVVIPDETVNPVGAGGGVKSLVVGRLMIGVRGYAVKRVPDTVKSTIPFLKQSRQVTT
jgi:hypothetical protein